MRGERSEAMVQLNFSSLAPGCIQVQASKRNTCYGVKRLLCDGTSYRVPCVGEWFHASSRAALASRIRTWRASPNVFPHNHRKLAASPFIDRFSEMIAGAALNDADRALMHHSPAEHLRGFPGPMQRTLLLTALFLVSYRPSLAVAALSALFYGHVSNFDHSNLTHSTTFPYLLTFSPPLTTTICLN